MDSPGAGMQKSTIMVVPPATAALVPHSKSSAETVPMKRNSMCVCGSMPPGRMSQPPASIISQPVGAAIFSATATILSASIRTSARREWSWLITVPPRMSMAMGCPPDRIVSCVESAVAAPVRRCNDNVGWAAGRLLQRSVDHDMAPGAFGLLANDRLLAAGAEQRRHRALIIGGIELAVTPRGEFVDLTHHALLVRLLLGAARIVVEYDLDRFVRTGAGKLPALHRGAHELRHPRYEGRVRQLALKHVEAVLHGGDALVGIVEDDEVLGLQPGIDDLPVLVVGHGGAAPPLLLDQRSDVEALLAHLDAAGRAVGLITELGHPGQEGVLVAEAPDAERLVLEVGRRGDARILAAGEHHAGPFEGLGDVDQRHALFACGERGGHPVDDDVGSAAGDHLRRRDVGATGLDGDIETLGLVEALVLGDVVAGKLRLRHPFQLQRYLVLGGCGKPRSQDQHGADHQTLRHTSSPFLVSAMNEPFFSGGSRGARRSPFSRSGRGRRRTLSPRPPRR